MFAQQHLVSGTNLGVAVRFVTEVLASDTYSGTLQMTGSAILRTNPSLWQLDECIALFLPVDSSVVKLQLACNCI